MDSTLNNSATPYKARIRMLTSRSGNQENLVFFATLAMRLEPVEVKGLGTVGTDGVNFFWDPAVWATWTLDEQIGVWAHEVMHLVTGHLFRKGSRDKMLWNVAGDYCINPVLKDFGLSLPKGHLHEAKYCNKTAEAVYEDIYKNAKKVACSMCSGHDPKSTKDDKSQNNAEGMSVKELEQEWKQATIQAAAVAREAGNLPAGLESLVDALMPKINWQERLRLWLGQRSKTEYKFLPSNRRYLHQGLYLPSMSGQQLDLVWIMDTSGSMDDELLAQGIAEVRYIRQKIKTTLRILHVDTEVAQEQFFDIHATIPKKFKWEGRGGTNLQVAFDYLRDKNYQVSGIVTMTDGYTYPAPVTSRLNVPMLWLLTDGHTGEKFYQQGDAIELGKARR